MIEIKEGRVCVGMVRRVEEVNGIGGWMGRFVWGVCVYVWGCVCVWV